MKDSKSAVILDAATKVIAEKGYQYATTEEIAREAGVAKGLIHFYFENKLDLLLSVLLLFWQKINIMNKEKLVPLKNPVDKLNAIFTTFQDLLSRDKKSLYWGRILNESLPQIHSIKSESLRKKQQAIARENRKLMKTVDSLIQEGQKQGMITNNLKPQVLRQILGGASQLLTYGMYFQLYSKRKIEYDEDDVRIAMETLIKKFATKKVC
jgi:TetR/AcrR family fatty acid metabolism transcriptional regulator